MQQKLLLKTMLLLCALIAGSSSVWATTTTYQHVFNAKPSTGSNITLSSVKWDISATNLGNYNSGNYAGVQLGTSSNNGSITLTSSSAWGTETGTYKDKTVITEVRLWLNLGGTSVTPSVTIGGKSATSDGTTVVKNSSAGTDWTKATKVTFTPASDGKTGVVVINVSTVKAGYICAMEIDCEESTGPITYSVTYNSNGATSGTVPTDATAYSSGATVTVLGNTGSLAKTGYVFAGWNTQENGQGTNYTAGNTFSITASTTLYAKWNFAVTDGIFDFVEAAAAGEDYGSGVTTTSSSSEYVTTNKTWTAGNVTMVTGKDSGNGYRWWSSDGTLRFYDGAKATFSVPSGYVITKIVTEGANFNSATPTGLSGSTWTGVSNSVVLKVNGGRNIKKITVTYTVTPGPSDPVDNGDNTITITTTANMDGWRAFYNASQGYTVDANTTIYVAAKSGTVGKVELTPVATKDIPQGEAVILKTTDAGHSMTLTETTGAATLGANVLTVTDGTNNVDGYRLGYKDGIGVAFFKYTTTTAPAAGIVYIDKSNVNTGSGAPSFLTIGNETTGVNEVRSQMEEIKGDFYNLNGQRVSKPTKGLYIVNGKKYIVK